MDKEKSPMSNVNNTPVENGRQAGQARGSEPRHPGGCPIDGHQGYGCACNQIRTKR